MSIHPTAAYQQVTQFFYNHGKTITAAVTGAALLGIAAYGATLLYNRYFPSKLDRRIGSAELKKTYHVENVLAELDRIKGGQKVCLFIGRRPEEELPTEEGKLWVSGDIDAEQGIPEGRLHLWLDFSDPTQLTQLHDRFDEIVIDSSVTKFLKGNFVERFITLLTDSQERVLVFEAFDAISYRADWPEVYYNYSNMVLPWEYYKKEEKINEAKEEAIKQINNYCLQYFNEVTFHRTDTFYYPRDDVNSSYEFIVCKGIKV